ncbi:hypothetical protein AK830_g10384 [Neonectria ditissima]|uniref:Cuticle-degrading protease n=1 Tax=Neonectria ditissima TaxID=78410 RepID=A0A0P7B749_9HYPO|nr:hypothetical protein AK830_g10384 [Neonectria ditissima]
MKFTATLYGLTGLLGLALAAAPIKNANLPTDQTVPDKYIVTYKVGTSTTSQKKHQDDVTKQAKKKDKEGVVDAIAIGSYKGYVAEIPSSSLKDILNSDLVAYVEKDSVVNVSAVAASPEQFSKRGSTTQVNAPWGLARISHKGPELGSFGTGYNYDTTAGGGVRVYVVDTGIRTTHSEFSGGRAVWGANYISGSPNTDEFGHGTHVAGTIAGKTFGVAKSATVVAVKVLDKTGSGTMSGIIQGLNWAVDNAKSRGAAGKSVVNMSVGGAYTASVNAAVKAATDAGLTVVVAAGNSADDAGNYSPSSAPTAITVGAVEGTNTRTWFSNYGSLVDIWAFGDATISAYNTGDSATRYLAGTSMASPHVAGLAAYFIAKEGLSGAAVANRIFSAAITGLVSDAGGGADRVAYNACGK